MSQVAQEAVGDCPAKLAGVAWLAELSWENIDGRKAVVVGYRLASGRRCILAEQQIHCRKYLIAAEECRHRQVVSVHAPAVCCQPQHYRLALLRPHSQYLVCRLSEPQDCHWLGSCPTSVSESLASSHLPASSCMLHT